MNIIDIIYLLELILFFLKTWDFTYLFQIKEYRFDRFFSLLKEENLINTFIFRRMRKPAVSFRNILIFIICVSISSIIFPAKPTLLFILIFPIVLPLASFIFANLSVLITSPFAYIRRKQIIDAAKRKIADSNAVFIGITGSYGKTTTKEILYEILKTKYKVGKTDENMNTEVGVAISILKNLKPDTQYFIAEIGAYKKGEIKAVCDYIHPKYGMLTAIGNQHLDLFGSRQNLITAKAELLESLPKDGIAYVNKDTGYTNELLKNVKCKAIFFSAAKDSTAPVGFETHNISNLLPCIALAQELNIPKEKINQIITHLKPVAKRLVIKKGVNGSTVLDDSYNSNVEGFIAAIEAAIELKKKKRIIITRGIIELGIEKRNSYQKIIDHLYRSSLQLYTTDKLFKEMDNKNQVTYFSSENLLLQKLIKKLDNSYLLVIEGKFHPETIKQLI